MASQFSRTQEIMSNYFTQWAFTVSLDGDSVQVFNKSNVELVKKKLEKHGLGDVRVTYLAK